MACAKELANAPEVRRSERLLLGLYSPDVQAEAFNAQDLNPLFLVNGTVIGCGIPKLTPDEDCTLWIEAEPDLG